MNQAGKPVFNRTIRRAGLLSFVSRYPDAVACLLQAGGDGGVRGFELLGS